MKKLIYVIVCLIIANFSFAQKNELPIFKEKLNRGIYRTFNEFINNRPGITEPFYITYHERKSKAWKGTYSTTPRYREYDGIVRKAWGYCSGNEVYIKHQKEYFKLKLDSNKIGFWGYGPIDNSESFKSFLAFGIVGLGVYAETKRNQARKNKTYYIIDPHTGVIKNTRVMKKQQKARLIIYRKAKKENKHPMRIIVNESLEYSLLPYSFIELKFMAPFKPVKIKYGPELRWKNDVILNPGKTKYLECRHTKKDINSKVLEVTEQTGKFYSDQAKHFQEKRVLKNK